MRRALLFTVAFAVLAIAPLPPSVAGQESQRARPRTNPPATSQPPRQAVPRQAEPRRAAPQRVLPPRYHVPPRIHYFPPIGTHRDFYYHPYFGFYYGPYYGPFYPYPGPYFGPDRYSATVLRTKVKPEETMVYVNGYYAGEADDFDGIFQGLYLPAGEHTIEFFLEGYRTYRQHLYLNRGDSRDIVHHMERLQPPEVSAPPMAPRGRADTPLPPTAMSERPASPLGILTIHVEPTDASVLIDGEETPALAGDLVVHLNAGWHELEIRRNGYLTLRTNIELTAGDTTRLNVKLVR
jgi:hypothetical protein